MFQVIGDTIYCDGQPLAVITMPLCRLRMDAVDALNDNEYYAYDDVAAIVREIDADVNHVVETALTDAIDAFWITGQQSELITEDIKARLVEKLCMTLAAWKAV